MFMHLVLVSAIAAIVGSQHCLYTSRSIAIDVEKIAGPWYTQVRFGLIPFPSSGCSRFSYTAHENDEGFSAVADYKNSEDQFVSLPLEFYPAGSTYYKFTSSGITFLGAFLAMEYDSYAVFYDCSTILTFGYVLTRSQERNDTVIDKAIKEAKQVSPLLPWPSSKLNCDIF